MNAGRSTVTDANTAIVTCVSEAFHRLTAMRGGLRRKRASPRNGDCREDAADHVMNIDFGVWNFIVRWEIEVRPNGTGADAEREMRLR